MFGTKILVTGGAGYIGSHTVAALHQAGYRCVIVDNLSRTELRMLEALGQITGEDLPFYPIDCTDPAALASVFRAHPDIAGVIHFAAYKAVGESVEIPTTYYRNNIGSTAVLLDVMREHGVQQLVFSSSCTVYGEPERIPVDEHAPILPAQSPYGYTKQVCEQLIRDESAARPELRASLLRYFNPIGAHPSALLGELPLGKPNNLIPFLTQAVAGWREPLTLFGDDYPTPDGTCIRDYIHVMDLAEAHVAALKHLPTAGWDVFNLGTGKGHSVKEVVSTFEAVNGLPVPHRIGPRRAGDVIAIYADPSKAQAAWGWSTKRQLGEALRDAWRWQQQLKKA
jgi:UDP-glucose 4-epimerase